VDIGSNAAAAHEWRARQRHRSTVEGSEKSAGGLDLREELVVGKALYFGGF
jgi:hypothetical protein